MNYSATIQLINGWTPQTLKDWLDEGCTCDLTVKAGKWHGARVLNVIITEAPGPMWRQSAEHLTR